MALNFLYEDMFYYGADDIVAHLPALRWLAGIHNRVTEFGVRNGNSTVALLMGNPNVVSYDIQPCGREQVIKKNAPGWTFILGNTLEANIDETDLLFIDTVHTYEQLSAELTRHHRQVTSTIALHDVHVEQQSDVNDAAGMQRAVAEFVGSHPEWRVGLDVTVCNGFTILCRSDS